MYCMHCGTENPDSYVFCRKCGARLVASDHKPVAVDVIAVLYLVTGILAVLFALVWVAMIVYALISPVDVLVREKLLEPGQSVMADVVFPFGFVAVAVMVGAIINFVLAWGVWRGSRLVYVITFVVAILWCVTLIGIPISIAVLVMLLRPGVKRFFQVT